jgi:hypothetical protein
MNRARFNLGVQVRAGELVIAVTAGDVGISVVEARGEVANILGRLSRDSGKHGGGDLEALVDLADVLEHAEERKTA